MSCAFPLDRPGDWPGALRLGLVGRAFADWSGALFRGRYGASCADHRGNPFGWLLRHAGRPEFPAAAGAKARNLKDSNSGAFAVIGCGLYFLLTFCFWMEWYPQGRYTWMLALGFVLSRTLSGLSVVRFPCAKNSGLLAMFSHAAAKKRTAWVLVGYFLLCGGAMLLFGTFVGAVALCSP